MLAAAHPLATAASLVPIVSVAVTGLLSVAGAYVVNRRTKSGRIVNSEASDLWSEGRAMRDFLAAEVERLSAELSQAREEMTAILKAIAVLREQATKLFDEVTELRAQVAQAALGEKEREATIKALMDLLEKHGVSPADMAAALRRKPRARKL